MSAQKCIQLLFFGLALIALDKTRGAEVIQQTTWRPVWSVHWANETETFGEHFSNSSSFHFCEESPAVYRTKVSHKANVVEAIGGDREPINLHQVQASCGVQVSCSNQSFELQSELALKELVVKIRRVLEKPLLKRLANHGGRVVHLRLNILGNHHGKQMAWQQALVLTQRVGIVRLCQTKRQHAQSPDHLRY